MSGRLCSISALLLFCALQLVDCAHKPAQNSAIDRGQMAARVKREFMHAWQGYKRYAWGHDELKPLSKSYKDWYSASLYMTPVDAMDTMYLMGFRKEADDTREFVATHLSFDHDMYVKNFEIVIRILGGLLSNYQLTNDKRLLDLARDLGNRLMPVFHSSTEMPYMYINLKTGAVRGSESNPAEIGTLLIEFGTLSKLTENPEYYNAAKKSLVALYNHRSAIGLVGSTIDVETGMWKDASSHISGGIDSYYEYLLKCGRLFGDEECKTMWSNSVAAVNRHLADETPAGFWYKTVQMNTGETLATHFGALDAFFPAVLALSGDRDRASRLEDSAYRMWTTFGIEPEEIDYRSMKITYDGYALRPEIIESAYYLYHFTKDPRYLQMGLTFFNDLMRYCRTDSGYAALASVATKQKKDAMESFFLAETLKYLYLLFADPPPLDFSQVTFNTEAHPIRKTW